LRQMQHDTRTALWSLWKVCIDESAPAHLPEWEKYGKKHGLRYDKRVETSETVTFEYRDDGAQIARDNPRLPKLDQTMVMADGASHIELWVVLNTDRHFRTPQTTRGTFGPLPQQSRKGGLIRINARFADVLSEWSMADRYWHTVTDFIDNAMGTVEHELTHYVQYFYFAHRDRRQVQSTSGRDVPDALGYNTSNIEFDPKIKSAITDFATEVSKMVSPTPRRISEKIREFVAADGFDPARRRFYQNEFFWALRKTDEARWKKAIRIFTTNMRNMPEFEDTEYLKNFW
jgi:hypothetical protein